MFFTRIGRGLAVLAMIFGILKVVMGFAIASGAISLASGKSALSRYFPGYSSTGELIDAGLYMVIFSFALGILTEISYAVRSKQ